MPSIKVKCPSCGSRLKAKESLAGKKTKCPQCQTLIEVPDPNGSIESVAAALLANVRETPSRVSNTVLSTEIFNGIVFKCPFCYETYQVSLEMAGKSILCRNCRASSKVPMSNEPDDFAIPLDGHDKQREESPTSSMLVRGIPRPIMRQFKAWCHGRGITMKDKITEMIRECLKEG